ncbi:Peptidyl-prolyl cis-trans isomerase PpiB [hydrothermal vent metagenome]|uniref:peptidylprolyl isomerase n=1 Tax=hydrothermal vent metagenome TaxID=652676 RepID=A0A1W1CHC6_9ZZZZ
MVTLETTLGNIEINLFTDKAPETVKNFLTYVEQGFYTDTIFHRVIKDFMVQGGGMLSDMSQKPNNPPIKNEADNGLSNSKYTIAMARTNIPDSATSQFFINTNNNTFLNFTAKTMDGWGYCVFGEVTKGQDVIDKINLVSTGNSAGHADVPVEPVIITGAKIS